jgi:hypothetical protein
MPAYALVKSQARVHELQRVDWVGENVEPGGIFQGARRRQDGDLQHAAQGICFAHGAVGSLFNSKGVLCACQAQQVVASAQPA